MHDHSSYYFHAILHTQESLRQMATQHNSAAVKRPVIKVQLLTILIINLALMNDLSVDTTVRIEAPTEAEMEEREGLAFWNVWIPKSGGVQGEGVHWRREYIIKEG